MRAGKLLGFNILIKAHGVPHGLKQLSPYLIGHIFMGGDAVQCVEVVNAHACLCRVRFEGGKDGITNFFNQYRGGGALVLVRHRDFMAQHVLAYP